MFSSLIAPARVSDRGSYSRALENTVSFKIAQNVTKHLGYLSKKFFVENFEKRQSDQTAVTLVKACSDYSDSATTSN